MKNQIMTKQKLNNKGSAMVSVLVVTVFITVIATTMLYISAQNYQMKQTDYQNKQSFYGAEEALDSLKAALVSDVQTAYMEAYVDVTQNFVRYKTNDRRKQEYQKKYIEKLEAIWSERQNAAVGITPEEKLLEAVKRFMIDEVGLAPEIANRIYKVESYGVGNVPDSTEKQFVIKGVRAKYTSGNYTTFLYTDICFVLPDLALEENSVEFTGTEATERKLMILTDYVAYMNWRKADYFE